MTFPHVVAVRRGRMHPHFDEPAPDDARLFAAYIRAAHGRHRFAAIRELLRALIAKAKSRKHSMKPIGIIGGGLGGLSAACVLAARGHKVILFERNDWLGGKAAQLQRRRLPLRHGADHRHDAVGAAPHLQRGRRAPGGLPRPRAARSAVALLLRRRLVLDLAQNPEAMAQTLDAFAPGTNSGAALPRLHRLQRAARRHLAAPLLLEADRRPARHVRLEGVVRSEDARRRARDAHGPLGRRHRAQVHARSARRADARPLHAVRRLVALRLAGRALRHRPHADRRGRLVSDGRHARRARGAGEARDANSASSSAPARRSRRSSRTAAQVTGVRTDARRGDRAQRRRLQLRLRAHPPRTAQRRGRRRPSSAGASTSPPAPASCSISA